MNNMVVLIYEDILEYMSPKKVHCRSCKGPLSGLHIPKIGQNCMNYDILGTFRTFLIQRSKR